MQVGDRIGSYRIVRLLGSGGMGTVYEALDEVIEGRAAIKILQPEWAQSAELSARFLNEARAVNKVKHPGIVRVYAFGRTDDGTAYIVMEYLDGQPLSVRLNRNGSKVPLPSLMVMRLARQLASALVAAHRAGIIHRDIKPDNIFLVPDPDMPGGERAKLLDFGLAKLYETRDDARVHTKSRIGLGTPDYMAPEQCYEASEADGRADVYALGMVLFELLAGRLPVEGKVQDILRRRVIEEAPPLLPLLPDADPQFVALLQRMIARDRNERPTMGEVFDEIISIHREDFVNDTVRDGALTQAGRTARSRMNLAITIGAGLLALSGAVVLLMPRLFHDTPDLTPPPSDLRPPDLSAPVRDLAMPPPVDLRPPADLSAAPLLPDLATPPRGLRKAQTGANPGPRIPIKPATEKKPPPVVAPPPPPDMAAPARTFSAPEPTKALRREDIKIQYRNEANSSPK